MADHLLGAGQFLGHDMSRPLSSLLDTDRYQNRNVGTLQFSKGWSKLLNISYFEALKDMGRESAVSYHFHVQ